MAHVDLPVAGPSEKARALAISPQRSWNLAPWVYNGKPAMIGTAGLELLIDLGADDETIVVRGAHVLDGRPFVVAGDTVYELFADGTSTAKGSGSTLPSTTGRVGMSDNAGKIVIGDGTGLFVLDLTADSLIETLVEGVTPIATSIVGYVDGYTIAVLNDSGQVVYSDLNDPGTFPGLNFFTAEAAVDNAVSMVINNREVFILGPDSVEPWADTGGADNAFERVDGGVSLGPGRGCGAPHSANLFDGAFAWIGSTPMVWYMEGYTPKRISDDGVDFLLAQEADLSAVTAFTWQEQGHDNLQLNLTGTSLVYDAATSAWFERRWLNAETGDFERHRAEFAFSAFGGVYVGDYANGKIYRQSLSIYSDDGNPKVGLQRLRIPGPRTCWSLDECGFDMEVGVGLDGVGQGTDPQAMFRVSWDNGANWSNREETPIGKIGESDQRVVFRQQGSSRDLNPRCVVELSVSDPVLDVRTGGWAEIS